MTASIFYFNPKFIQKKYYFAKAIKYFFIYYKSNDSAPDANFEKNQQKSKSCLNFSDVMTQ